LPPILARPGLHTTGFYVAFFMAMGAYVPFWPIWLEAWGLTAAEVGLYTAVGVGVRVVAGMAIPALADNLDARRHTLAACILLSIALFVWHLWIGSKAVLLVATLAVGATLAGVTPISEALGLAAALHHGFAYAQARGLGSGGYLAANLATGVIVARHGADAMLWLVVACLLAALVLVPGHPGARKVQGQIPPKLGEIGRLTVNPVFVLFMAAVAFIQSSHAVLFSFGTIHWVALGIGESTIGALWATSVGAEIVFMVFFGAWTVLRLGPVASMALCGLAGIVRWGAMMFDPTGWLLWPLQCLHAFTFGIGHLGAIAFIAQAVPARFGAAAQGATSAMAVGLVLALGMLLAAAVYPVAGGRTYGLGMSFSALGLGLCWLLARRWRGEELAV
jgi:PPP family 3-phenylpropionic acid transporter